MRVRFLVMAALLVFAALPVTTTTANPLIPSCPASIAAGTSLTMDNYDPALCEAYTQIKGGEARVFPEALDALDFVGFFEFQRAIEYLNENYPDYIEIYEVATSFGLTNEGGSRDRLPVYVVEITNENSPVPMDQRQELLFMLSIHGNEKGGREGGFRVLEDLVKNIGIGSQRVQDGAGLADPIQKPTGGNVETYHDYLDFMRINLLFANPDGWAKDELPYVATEAGLCGTLFCRTNGNGTDLNRQMPTIGWQLINPSAGRLAMNEPEAQGYNNWMVDGHTWDYAVDIHGMLNHENFVAIMMPAGSFSPQEMYRSTKLAETLKQRLNDDPYFSTWTSAWQAVETATAVAGGATCDMVDLCILEDSSDLGVGSSTFAEWSTVWDAIGYTDAGFSGDFFAQTTGLNAPGYGIELAYNHITVDSQYQAAGIVFNDYHVHSVREITKSFMDAAALDSQISYDAQGKRTAYVESPYVATNLDDDNLRPGGWATSNPTDDFWEYSAENPFTARPSKYWEDIKPFLRDGDAPGVLNGLSANRVTPSTLANYDNLILAGSAINAFIDGPLISNQVSVGQIDEARIQAILDWVEAGGNLVLTDASLEFFDLAGLSSNAVDVSFQYAGASNLDREHPLTADVRGAARQTYEPVPLGFAVGSNAPSWNIDRSVIEGLGGEVAGTALAGSDLANLGRVNVGSGSIQFLGAVLPDPTEEFYHPYGLDDYSTTYSGNQILRNMLGWSQSSVDPPVIVSDAGVVESDNERTVDVSSSSAGSDKGGDRKTSVLGLVPILALLGALAILNRRRD